MNHLRFWGTTGTEQARLIVQLYRMLRAILHPRHRRLDLVEMVA